MRYADDFVMGFESGIDARRMLADLKERLAGFGLMLHEDKTRLIEFRRFAALTRQERGERRPEDFAFQGFTHYCGLTRDGRFIVKHKIRSNRLMGENFRISTVAIQQGNLTITVRESPAVSQPAPFSSGGQTQVVPQSSVSVEEEQGRQFLTLKEGVSLSVLVRGLNALGVTPREMISILQTIRAAGALQAEIEVL